MKGWRAREREKEFSKESALFSFFLIQLPFPRAKKKSLSFDLVFVYGNDKWTPWRPVATPDLRKSKKDAEYKKTEAPSQIKSWNL